MKKIPWNKKKRPTKEFLVNEYDNKHKSVDRIAKELQIGKTTLHRWFKEYNIKKRTSAESTLPKNFKEPTKEEQTKLYLIDGLSIRDLAKRFNVSTPTICRLLEKNHIPIRTLSEQQNFGKKLPDKETLERLRNKEKLSFLQIGILYGLKSGDPIKKLCKEQGILYKIPIKKFPKNFWIKEKVIDYIKELFTNGESLKSVDIKKNHTSVYHASYNFFGNWQKAVEASEIDYNSLLQNPWKWSRNKEQILVKLRELEKQKINLSDKGLRKHDKQFYSAITNHFKSVYIALEKAGINPDKYRIKQNNSYWTKEKVLSDVKKLLENNIDLSSQNIRKNYSELWSVCMKNFGGWIRILREVGVNPEKISRLYANTKEFKKYIEDELTKSKLENFYYEQGLSELAIGELFSCGYKPIQRLLNKQKLIPRKSKFGSHKRIVCSDGHKVLSSYEFQVCEWLTRHNIIHEYDVKLSYNKYDGDNKIKIPKYRPDFKIKDKAGVIFYIEVWGLAGIKDYDERTRKKKLLYQELKEKFGYQLIEIFPKDSLTIKLGFLVE